MGGLRVKHRTRGWHPQARPEARSYPSMSVKPRRSHRPSGSSHSSCSVTEPLTLSEQLWHDLLKPGRWTARKGGVLPFTQDKPRGLETHQRGLPAGPLGGADNAGTGRLRACVDLGSPETPKGPWAGDDTPRPTAWTQRRERGRPVRHTSLGS